ncbi:MAG: hypothetical protein LKF79_05525 [Solobacterium sp.]|jgi:high-affinity Fe2+/Pb2+ permease|nr:hypothetical protein [Solobacterium sp.]MCH4222480.1 hypothetical protein [Solobacterium sp.]MCH4266084.1 hypothetical protein [Solobacterium sp.]
MHTEKQNQLIMQANALLIGETGLGILNVLLLSVSSSGMTAFFLTISLILIFTAAILVLCAQWHGHKRSRPTKKHAVETEEQYLERMNISRARLLDASMIVLITSVGFLIIALIWRLCVTF